MLCGVMMFVRLWNIILTIAQELKLRTLAITYHHNFDAIDDISGNCDMVDYIGEEEYFNEMLERVTLFNV